MPRIKLDVVSDLEAAAEQQKAEAAASAAGEAAAVQRIRALYDSNLELREHYSTVQEEMKETTDKKTKLQVAYQKQLNEVVDLQEVHARDVNALQEELALLIQQIKLKDLVIMSYIPAEQQKRIVQHSVWDASQQCWRIPISESRRETALERGVEGEGAERSLLESGAFSCERSGRPSTVTRPRTAVPQVLGDESVPMQQAPRLYVDRQSSVYSHRPLTGRPELAMRPTSARAVKPTSASPSNGLVAGIEPKSTLGPGADDSDKSP